MKLIILTKAVAKADLAILISAVCILIFDHVLFFACNEVLNITYDRCSCMGLEV